ncbi:hypothetical protein ACJZ2D_014494 [Fusarium nematophilum]
MATIKQIDGRTVHQIQSGQVIVDLCSVVKELVENSVDAGATSIDVRFKNQGLDLIEVGDNGTGIAPANYASVALKHHTSKLSSYSDISTLQTFGFRGEALASLCALSILTVTTCQADEAPKGTKLSFEASGKLSGTAVLAASKGTTVSVERLFHNLPVRRRELERNIKREWNKVIALLNQYACIQTNLKFSVSQQPNKGKRIHLFSTRGNATTRENIINIFGAKTMTTLVPLDLNLEMAPSTASQIDPKHTAASRDVRVVGHVSRPSHGDGRQTPDRQMFFVNGRPCGLPQFAKAFNEVYRSYNSSQNPFIMANIRLDTHMYDVNVSPDKRSILLHDQNDLLDTLRASLTKLFDSQDYSVPTSQLLQFKTRPEKQPIHTPAKSQSTLSKDPHDDPEESESGDEVVEEESSTGVVPPGRARIIRASRSLSKDTAGQNLISGWVERKPASDGTGKPGNSMRTTTPQLPRRDNQSKTTSGQQEPGLFVRSPSATSESDDDGFEKPLPVRDFNKRLKETSLTRFAVISEADGNLPTAEADEPPIPALQAVSGGQDDQHLVSPMRSTRNKVAPETTTIIIGDENVQDTESPSLLGVEDGATGIEEDKEVEQPKPSFGCRLTQIFAAGSKSFDEKTPLQKIPNDEDTDGPDCSSSGHTDGDGSNSVLDTSDQEADIDVANPSIHAKEREDHETEDSLPNSACTPSIPSEPATAEQKGQPLTSGVRKRDATVQILHHFRTDEGSIRSCLVTWMDGLSGNEDFSSGDEAVTDLAAVDAEEKLSLTIARTDFLKMRIAGQFNLGFIIAIRPAKNRSDDELELSEQDELFIIDQHATDEKYNFERLQEIHILQSQRLVYPKRLELTALEEEIVMQNIPAIEANGFKIQVDTSGEEPVGSRCEVLALPMSRETTFTLEDFEELIALLGEESSESKHIPRPSKVRKIFASRACRSSIMIGKPLTQGQMETGVGAMTNHGAPQCHGDLTLMGGRQKGPLMLEYIVHCKDYEAEEGSEIQGLYIVH